MQSDEWIKQYTNELGTRESVSGVGSTLENTIELRTALPQIFRTYGIKTMIDMPCGDWNWMKEVHASGGLQGVSYTGYDIVPEMIASNGAKYPVAFQVHDAINDPIPPVDLVLCRDFLFHLANDDVIKVLEHTKSAKYLLVTTFPGVVNTDLPQGYTTIGWRKINLCGRPFNLPEPEYIVQENDSPSCMSRIVGLFRRTTC